MMAQRRLVFIPIIALFVFFLFSGIILAQKPLEITYPPVPDQKVSIPQTTETPLPEYLRYLFTFALSIAGVIAFGSLIYGGFRYVTSAGSPSALSDAKSQIFAAVLGIITLTASYLILTTINPQLVRLKAEIVPSLGIILTNAAGEQKRLGTSQADLGDFNPTSISFLPSSQGKLEVTTYDGANYQGNGTLFKEDGQITSPVKSVLLSWIEPGVYLYGDTNTEQMWTNVSIPILSALNDKVKKIVFKGDLPFAAILHEDAGYQGQCRIFLPNGQKEWTDVQGAENEFGKVNNVSSATVFLRGGEIGAGENVKLCKSPDYTECRTITDPEITSPRFFGDVFGLGTDLNDQVRSIKIEGNYLVVLTENAPGDNFPGKCQVFNRRSDPDLKDDPIGQCNVQYFGFWGEKQPCASSVAVFHIK